MKIWNTYRKIPEQTKQNCLHYGEDKALALVPKFVFNEQGIPCFVEYYPKARSKFKYLLTCFVHQIQQEDKTKKYNESDCKQLMKIT